VKSDWRARLDLVAAAGLFSTGGAAIKACSLQPLQIAGLRSLVAGLFLLLVWPAARRGLKLRSLPRSLLFAVFYASTLLTFVSANKLTTSANAIYLQSTAPLWLLLLAPLLLGERVRRADLVFMGALAIGLACCMVDDLAASRAATQATAPHPRLGDAIALGSGVLWGATILGLRANSRGSAEESDAAAGSIVVGNCAGFVGAALLSPHLAAPLGGPFFDAKVAGLLDVAQRHDLLALLYLGALQVGLAYVALARGMRRVPALEASLLLLVEPVFNPIWTFLVHRERPGTWALAGGGVILGATALHTWLAPRVAPSAPATTTATTT
jgi:drug/metabolite transporter (DMT)-like permease